jgi:hypothetical protein
LINEIALQKGGEAANKAVERRVTGKNVDELGRKIAPKRVKEYKKREPWVKAEEKRIIGEVTSPRRIEIGRVKPAREDKRHSTRTAPPVVFQQLRAFGGVFRSLAEYEAQNLRGGTPIVVEKNQTWLGRSWSTGDVWGFRWSGASAFHAAQGTTNTLDLGGRGSRIWRAATSKARQKKSGNARLTLGFKGRRPRGDATFVLADWGKKTKTGRTRKKSIAEIVGVANSRDREGFIGEPDRAGGNPHGGKADLGRKLSEARVHRWRGLRDREIERTIMKALGKSALEAMNRAPTEVRIFKAKPKKGKVK